MDFPDSVEAWARVLTMLPILVCSVIGSALTVAKWLEFRRSRRIGDTLLEQVRSLISARDYARVLAVTQGSRSQAARLIERSLTAARVMVAADERVSHGRVIEVVDLIRQAGIFRLDIETFSDAARRRSP